MVVFPPGSQLAKGKRLFHLQMTLCASVSGVGRKRDSLPRDVADTRDGKGQGWGNLVGTANPAPPTQTVPGFCLRQTRVLCKLSL